MQCKQCQQDVPTESLFCPRCGAPLAADSPTAEDAPNGAQRLVEASRGRGGSPPEEDLWSGSYSAKAMAGAYIGAAMLTLLGFALMIFGVVPGLVVLAAAIVIWAVLVLVYLYRRITVRYRLSTFRFFHDTGLLSRTGNRVEVIDIDDVTVHQGLIERMFGVGTIHISSSDKTHPDLSLPGIDDAKHVADLIDGTRRAERNRRGLHIESI